MTFEPSTPPFSKIRSQIRTLLSFALGSTGGGSRATISIIQRLCYDSLISLPLTPLTMSSTNSTKTAWNVNFLRGKDNEKSRLALIILNQPFSLVLLKRLWNTTRWHCCADGGANRLYDTFKGDSERKR